jgi:signal transduction histidine kinase
MNIINDRLVSNRLAIWLFCLVLLCFSGCNYRSDKVNAKIDSILVYDDTRIITKQENLQLDSIRNLITNNDIKRLSNFYLLKYHYSNSVKKNSLIYVDSTLSLFKKDKNIDNYKVEYLNALLLKADDAYYRTNFSKAVITYLQAKSFRDKNLDNCYGKRIIAGIALVYYEQNNYLKAASYFKESYQLELSCKTATSTLTHFYYLQGLLNNIGFCYEQSNMLDSAKYFYQKDLAYIDSIKTTKKVFDHALNDASAVAFDNLGSIYLKQNNLAKAEFYLNKSINTPYSRDNGMLAPPMIKLAKLYLLKANYNKANAYLNESRKILDEQPNPTIDARWYKVKSEFFALQNQYEMAYKNHLKHIDLNNQVKKNSEKIAAINLEKDFVKLEQQYDIQDLQRRDSNKNLTLLFVSILLVLVVLAAILLQKNIKQSKKNSQIVLLHNEELKENLLKLEDVNQNYARIMKVMAHDLKNPLTGISSIANLLLEENEITKQNKNAIAIIKESAENALYMINEILNSFLFVIGKVKMKQENINVQLVLAQCVALLNFKANEKGQKLIFKYTNELIIHANKEKLWRLFNNLIVNAIKFSGTKQSIIIDIAELPRHIIVSITDKGIGIPDDIAAKIFDVFTEAKREGTAGEKAYGLGLSISKQIVDAHFGKIWFEKNTEGGTIFHVQLPR